MHQIRAWTQGPNHFKEFSEGLLLERGEVSCADGCPWEEESLALLSRCVILLCYDFTVIQ